MASVGVQNYLGEIPLPNKVTSATHSGSSKACGEHQKARKQCRLYKLKQAHNYNSLRFTQCMQPVSECYFGSNALSTVYGNKLCTWWRIVYVQHKLGIGINGRRMLAYTIHFEITQLHAAVARLLPGIRADKSNMQKSFRLPETTDLVDSSDLLLMVSS